MSDTTTENPALVRPKPTHPPTPWELTVERDELHRDCSLALSVISCPDTPKWLRDKAWETAEETGWWLTWGGGCGPRAIRLVPVLMHWQGAYQEYCAEFLMDMPDSVKAKYPLDVILAEKCAKAADTQGFSMDCRLESLEILNRTLGRLKDHADDDDDNDNEIEDDTIQLGYNQHA